MNGKMLGVGFVAWLVTWTGTRAEPIEVGAGVNEAELWLEFKDGATYTFDVAFGTAPEDTVTGLGLFDIIESETDLTTDRQDYGFGVFIDGISYEGHSNAGYGGGDDWWHYWIMESDVPTWTSPPYGVADRVVSDGDADGWVYGRAGEPVPEPGTLALLVIGAAFAVRQRR